jgi:glycosyltransferase involved in cell wall biosynthesis
VIIGIDASMLVYQGSGVANYTYNLIINLLKYAPENEYRVFYSSLRRPKSVLTQLQELRNLGGKVYCYRLPPRVLKYLWNTHHLLPIEWLMGKLDAFWSSDYLRPPLDKETLGITTVHDITWKIFPRFHTKKIVEAHLKKMGRTILFGDLVIFDSNSTQDDVFRQFPHIQNRNVTKVIYPGIGGQYQKKLRKKDVNITLKKYGIDLSTNYLIYVGAIEPRKNLDKAVKVFAQLIKKRKYQDFKFYLVGRAGWKNEKLFRLIKRLKLKEKVKFLGFIPDRDLPVLYKAARANIYLSKYEGFGLPPIEAASCGTPTLLYANSSLKELFHSSYPYATNNTELNTLINIINNKQPELYKTYSRKYSWKLAVKQIKKILDRENKKLEYRL